MKCPNCGVYCTGGNIFCCPPIHPKMEIKGVVSGHIENEKSSYNPGPTKSPMEPDPWLDYREKTPTHMDF